MLIASRSLTSTDLGAIADLEARTVAADGGRLKLEWGTLRTRSGDSVEDLLWWDGPTLRGFLGLYSFGAPAVELAGMVDPLARRRGIGTALLVAARQLTRDRGYHPVLLVTSRGTPAAAAFARAHGGILEHSEHAMVQSVQVVQVVQSVLPAPPVGTFSALDVHLRPAGETDTGRVRELLADGFGFAPAESDLRVGDGPDRTLIVEVDGAAVGTLRLTHDGDAGRIYGFVIDSAHRGRGLGRAALWQACRALRTEGTQTVGLEVAVDNEHALGLYTSLGFVPVTTEDYYALPQGL